MFGFILKRSYPPEALRKLPAQRAFFVPLQPHIQSFGLLWQLLKPGQASFCALPRVIFQANMPGVSLPNEKKKKITKSPDADVDPDVLHVLKSYSRGP